MTVAAEALDALGHEIEQREADLAQARAAFDRVAADTALSAKAFKAVQAAESALNAAQARQAPLAAQAETEAAHARQEAAQADAKAANDLLADLVDKLAAIESIAQSLDAAVADLDQHAALKWSAAARKANAGGASVERRRLDNVAAMSEMLTRAALRVGHVAADYSQRAAQIR